MVAVSTLATAAPPAEVPAEGERAPDAKAPSDAPAPAAPAPSVDAKTVDAKPPDPKATPAGPALARFVIIDAGAEATVRALLDRVIEANQFEEPFGVSDREEDERILRRWVTSATEVLATEGYFTPTIEVAPDDAGRARNALRVTLGPRARVTQLDLDIKGPIEDRPQRLAEIKAAWDLPLGKPFRSADWSAAKTKIVAAIQERDFLAARLRDAAAEVDTTDGSVAIRIEIESGPPFTVGGLQIKGLKRYGADLIERYNPFRPGDPYDATKLLEFQRKLQGTPFFSSVLVDVLDDPSRPENVPIRIELVEAKPKRVSAGVGYSTNTGARLEATYRQTLVFGYPYTSQSGVGFDKTSTSVYSDLYLPPKTYGAVDSLGVLIDRTDINLVRTRRWALGAARQFNTEGPGATYEKRYTTNLQREQKSIDDPSAGPSTVTDVLSAGISWTRRTVDKITDPRRGDILTLALTGGLRRTSLDNLPSGTFARTYGRYLRYVPLSTDDQLIVRGEAGYVIGNDLSTIPEELLFRTGGAGSIRGYSYLGLGLQQGSAVLGNRALLVGSTEYVHWFNDSWGAATFYDIGDAGDRIDRFNWARGVGVGARWRTVAGPLALDLAYGERTSDGQGGRVRVHFSVAIAF